MQNFRAAAVFLLVLSTAPSWGADTWTRPFVGVRKLHRVTSGPAQDIHALEVTLTTPGLSLRSTASSERRQKTSTFARAVGAQLAVNGDFFSYADHSTSGLSAGNGARWSGTEDNGSNGTLAYGDGRVELSAPSAVVTFDASWMKGVVSGHPGIVRNGNVATFSSSSSLCTARHPRTAVGMSQDGTKLFLVVVDGRRSGATGMTCTELGTLIKGLGAHHAVNFDGGGSSTMYVAGQGVVNRPSDGTERTVANHLAIKAPATGTLGTLKGIIHQGTDTSARLSGATVRITGGPTITTTSTGLYEFEMPAGTYTITASKAGFVTESVTRTVTSGGTIWGSMGLVSTVMPVDTDGDGHVDTADNCVDVANADQLDTDLDDEGDACDGDDDGDLVPDEDDNCPLLSNAGQADSDGDRVGDACDATADAPRDAGVTEEVDAGSADDPLDAGQSDGPVDAPVTEAPDAAEAPGEDAGMPVDADDAGEASHDAAQSVAAEPEGEGTPSDAAGCQQSGPALWPVASVLLVLRRKERAVLRTQA